MFPHYGEVEGLHRELREYRRPLARVYEAILGRRRFEVLRQAEINLLTEGSFREDEVFLEYGEQQPEVVANRFIVARAIPGIQWLRCNERGRFEAEEICAAPGFILSEAGYEKNLPAYQDWMPGYLGSYIHLYNQFVLFVIQRFPMIVATDLLCRFLDPKINPTPPNFNRLVSSYPGTEEEKIAAAALASWGVRMASHCDMYGEYLDYQVFRMLGFEPPDDFLLYTGKTRREVIFLAPSIGRGFPLELGGDILGYPMDESIVVFEEWTERLKPANPWQGVFIRSVRATKLTKVPLFKLSR